jgi:hypothetical protein
MPKSKKKSQIAKKKWSIITKNFKNEDNNIVNVQSFDFSLSEDIFDIEIQEDENQKLFIKYDQNEVDKFNENKYLILIFINI